MHRFRLFVLTCLTVVGAALVWTGTAAATPNRDALWSLPSSVGAHDPAAPVAVPREWGLGRFGTSPGRGPPPLAGSDCARGACLPLWARAGQTPARPRGGPFGEATSPPAVVPLPGGLPLLLGGVGALAAIRGRKRRRDGP